MPASVLVGTQWGDEGNGKVTDLISGDFDVVARYAGGANAGHTVIAGGHKWPCTRCRRASCTRV